MKCEWIEFENKFKCKYCGFIVPNNQIKKICKNQTPAGTEVKPPSLIQRGMNFGMAAFNHVMTGMNHCTDEQKQARYNICQSNQCGLFKEHGSGGICAHDDCGCFLRSNGKFMDKLSWAESKCPVGLWGPIETKNT